MNAAEPLTTSQAARLLGIGKSTLNGWRRDGLVTPTFVTAGGHARWDLEDLKRQVRALQKRDS